MKNSYIAYIALGLSGSGATFYQWRVKGINGKHLLESIWYSKKSYALNRAKAFCAKTHGIKLIITGGM